DGNNTDPGGLSRLAYYFSDADPLKDTRKLTEVNAAQYAEITIVGTLTVSSTTNEISNVFDGGDSTAKNLLVADDDMRDLSV
ncbi:flagellar hook protein FliD, partial [Pseudoalteromonas sp. S1691]